MTEPPLVPPPAPSRPLAGFVPIFAWGLRYVLRWRKVLLVVVLAVATGALLGVRTSMTGHELRSLARVLDRGALGFGVPLIALLLAGDGFSYEVGSRTLGYHLVRPVSRTTVFLARFCAGFLPAAVTAFLFLATIVLASGVAVPEQVWWSLAATAGLSVLALGAIYYTLGAVLRLGLIAGLVYTFVVEMLLANVPGSMQRLSVIFHVRSLHHALTEGALPLVRPRAHRSGLLPNLPPVSDTGLVGAILVLGALATVVLVVGGWIVTRRDYALKD